MYKDIETRREYDRAYYARHRSSEKNRRKKLQVARVRRNSKEVLDYLGQHPCIDCGESDPVVLEFDHIKGKKIKRVSYGICAGWSLERIFAEIEKCVVRCANCHRRKTAKQRKYYRFSRS